MSYAFILPDACRAAEAALAQLTANIVSRKTSCKLSCDEIDYLRGRINAVRLKLVADEHLRELWPAPHVAIGVKNNVPLQYAVHVLGQIADTLAVLSKDCSPESEPGARLAALGQEMLTVRGILEDALALHLRKERVPLDMPEVVGEPGAITVTEVVTRYLDDMAKRLDKGDVSLGLFQNNRLDFTRFAQAYGSRPVAGLMQYDLTAWLEQNPQWRAVHTRRRVCNELIACFNFATEEGYIAKSPFKSPRALRGFKPNVRRPAEQREYVILMWKGGRELRRALFFLRRSGARTGEMRALRWEDCRLDAPPPHIHLAIHKTYRQTGKPRIIPLDATTARVLRAMKRNYERRYGPLTGKEYVFLNTDGHSWVDRHSFARHLRRTAERIGLDQGVVSRVSAYMLRHTFAVEALEAGIGIRQVADIMGHAKLDTISQFYGSHTRHHAKHLGNVIDEIAEARRKKRPPMKDNPGPDAPDTPEEKGGKS